jgi:hypothetical protein
MKYLLIVDFQPGIEDRPMDQWKPEEIEAHLDYYRRSTGSSRPAASCSTP